MTLRQKRLDLYFPCLALSLSLALRFASVVCWSCLCALATICEWSALKVVDVFRSDYPNNVMIMYQKQWTVCRIADNLLSLPLYAIFSVFFSLWLLLTFFLCRSLKRSWNGCQVLDQDSKTDEEAGKKSARRKILVGIAWTAPFIKRESREKKDRTSSNIFIKYYQKSESCVRCYQIDSHPLSARAFGAPWYSFSRMLLFLILHLCTVGFLISFFLHGDCVEKRMFEISIF